MASLSNATSLYIHVPFCLKKCPYCDFYSIPVENQDVSAYADLLLRHLDLLARESDNGKNIESIFFGGGTPSLLPAADVGRIIEKAQQQFGLTDDVEISLEVNPGTVNAAVIENLKTAGVNRLSIGVQAICDENLQTLGRMHTAAEALAVIDHARNVAFDNISCDLMFSLPNQTIESLSADLKTILALQPEHLAIYGLTIEAGTPFFSLFEQGQIEMPDEDQYVAAYQLLHEKLTTAGYRHYEISNFARPGSECRHNQRYWRRHENLAVGAGAHSFVDAGWGERRAVADDLADYSNKIMAGVEPSTVIENFDRVSAMVETVYLGLRTDQGIDAVQFKKRFGVTIEEAYPEAISKCGQMLTLKDGFWQLNLDGWLLFNTLLSHFH